MSSQGVMSSKKASNNPGLSPIEGQQLSAALPTRKESQAYSQNVTGWSPGPVWTLCRRDKYMHLLGVETRFFGHPAHSFGTILTTLYRLH